MFWTLLALLLWIVLGGFISYYGDLQGRRWGKKRISKFGLRPKHFAILITCITGGVISLLSVVSLLLIMPPVRDVLLHGEKAIRENKELIEKTKQDQQFMAKQLRDEANRLKVYESQLQETKGQLAPLTKQSEALRGQNVILLARKTELQARAILLEQQVKQQEAAVSQAKAKIASLNLLSKQLTSQNENASAINSALGKDNIAKTREVETLKHTLTDLQTDINKLQTTKTELTAQIQTLEANYKGINAAYNKLLDANIETSSALDRQIATLKQERDELNKQRELLISELAGNNHDFAQTYLALRGSKLAMRAGSELARFTVPANESADKVRADLNALLENASVVAGRYGATRGENGREVSIITTNRVTSRGTQTENEETSLTSFTTRLAGHESSNLVIAYVFYNTMVGEPVLVDLKIQEVKPAYALGETVATRRLDVRRATDEIFGNVLEFLQQEVRDAAIKKGVLARIDPVSGMPEVGVVSYSDLFRITDQVRRMGGTVKISAIARRNLTSADALDVELRTERIAKPGAGEVPSAALRSRN